MSEVTWFYSCEAWKRNRRAAAEPRLMSLGPGGVVCGLGPWMNGLMEHLRNRPVLDWLG